MTLKVGLVPMETTVQTISGLFFKSNDLCYEFLNLWLLLPSHDHLHNLWTGHNKNKG